MTGVIVRVNSLAVVQNLPMANLISFDEAVLQTREYAWRSLVAEVELGSAVGARLAETLDARYDSPRFDNAAMDGFAVASGGPPWQIVGEVAAGGWGEALTPGTATRIYTGAPIPEGTVSVLPIELARVEASVLEGENALGRHIRRRGEEYKVGQTLVSEGTWITPGVIATLAANGMSQVAVRSMPRVGILSTGSELLPANQVLGSNQIHDSNQPSLVAATAMLGCEVEGTHVADDLELTQREAQRLLKSCDVLVTLGGVSVGAHDYVPRVMAQLGFTTLFAGVNIKPGQPVSFGHRDRKAWFGLPGNPRSALITFIVLVREWMGCGPEWHNGTLAHDLEPSGARDTFELAHWSGDVRVFDSVGSHAVAGWAEANALVRIPANTRLRAGDTLATTLDLWRCL